jgi:hypothetical protein
MHHSGAKFIEFILALVAPIKRNLQFLINQPVLFLKMQHSVFSLSRVKISLKPANLTLIDKR